MNGSDGTFDKSTLVGEFDMVMPTIDYETTARKVKRTLLRHFPDGIIRTRKGYQGFVQVIVVSPRFNAKTEKQKQDLIWDILRGELGPDSTKVSIALAYGTDEPYDWE
jgi:stress-induced morphogen